MGSSCAAWASVGARVHTRHRGTEAGVPGRRQKHAPPPPVPGGDRAGCPPLRSLVGRKQARSRAVRAACGHRHPPWASMAPCSLPRASVRAAGGAATGQTCAPRYPAVAAAATPLSATAKPAAASTRLRTPGAQGRKRPALTPRCPPGGSAGSLLLDRLALPSWQSAASPRPGAAKKPAASL